MFPILQKNELNQKSYIKRAKTYIYTNLFTVIQKIGTFSIIVITSQKAAYFLFFTHFYPLFNQKSYENNVKNPYTYCIK